MAPTFPLLRYTFERLGFLFRAEVRDFFSAPKRLDRFWALLILLFDGYRGDFLEVMRPGREADHSPVFSARLRMSGAVPLLLLLLLWRYNCDRVLAFSTISFHLRRSCTCSSHFISFIFFISFLTSSSHRDLGLPAGLPVNQHCHYVSSPHINLVLLIRFNSRRLSSYNQPFTPLSRIFSMSDFPRRGCWLCAQPPLPWRT